MINLERVVSGLPDERESQSKSPEIEPQSVFEKLPLGLLNKFSEILQKGIGAENLQALNELLMYRLTEFLLDPKKLVQNIPLLETIFEIIKKRINEAYSELSKNEKLAKFINYLINLSEKYLKTLKESREVGSSREDIAFYLATIALITAIVVPLCGLLLGQLGKEILEPIFRALEGKPISQP
ncbi:MAG: hypothetical protein QW367_01925 [Candidatus Aenigmatarchaeota archaeon]